MPLSPRRRLPKDISPLGGLYGLQQLNPAPVEIYRGLFLDFCIILMLIFFTSECGLITDSKLRGPQGETNTKTS